MKSSNILVAAISVLLFSVGADASSYQAPLQRATEHGKQSVQDAQGRTLYLVDLYESVAPAQAQRTQPIEGLADHHNRSFRQVMTEMSQQYGFVPVSATSLVGKSFTAYLDEPQVAQLRQDGRVTRITEHFEIEFSATWSNSVVNGETKPWGVHAVGGGGSSNGTRVVYLLDSGVAPHNDLTLVERVAAVPGNSPTGCHHHATHVAGIVGAKRNNQHVVGVNPGVSLVSVAVGSGGTPTTGCSNGTVHTAAGLDLIKARISAGKHAGIVNISMNSSLFRQNNSLGMKLLNLAQPDPVTGYQGAFIVQSAGNGNVDACTVAYDNPTQTDGIMVASAIDANGQPAHRLNGLPRFRNSPNAGNEAGANLGNCVQVWAPGNEVLSTWPGGVAYLSGTSMAAPHIAGLASVLAETQSLTTPAAIEAAVRSRLVTLSGSSVMIPNLNLQGAVAQPSVEFADDSTSIPLPSGTVNHFDTELVQLRYQSIGADSCALRAYRDGQLWHQNSSMPGTHSWPASAMVRGQYRFELDCGAGAGPRTAITYNTRIRRLAWSVSTTSTGHQWQEFTGVAPNSTINATWSAGEPFRLRYDSDGASICEVIKVGYANFGWVIDELWDSGPLPSVYNFVTSYPPDPRTGTPAYDKLGWNLHCIYPDGVEGDAAIWATQSP
jgi:hypothetical protein